MAFLLKNTYSGKRTFYAFLNFVFNRVSNTRIKEVGPDIACAEWLMRNGAFLRWKGQPKFLTHYDNLPFDDKDKSKYFIEEINAEEASISHHGFPHFQGCNYITKIRFNNCWYINDSCLNQLVLLVNTLNDLEVTSCAEVTDKGLLSLQNLKNLKELRLGFFTSVEDFQKCASELHSALPNCNISLVKTLDKDSVK